MTDLTETASVALIEALTAIWTHIRELHPEVPPVIVLPAPSSDRKYRVLGHFAPLRWRPKADSEQVLHEVVVVAEHLDRSADDVVETLLHEAAHALNNARGIFDCSPTSQYHNSRFKAAAEELGLVVVKVPHYGWAYTRLAEATRDQYAALVDRLESVLVHRRKAVRTTTPPRGGGKTTTTDAGSEATPRNRLIKATCGCDPPYIIRASRTVLAAAEIVCRTCDERFSAT